MNRLAACALGVSLVACGGAAPSAVAPAPDAGVPLAKPAEPIALALDRASVSASPAVPGDPPRVRVTLPAPAGADGRHVTVVADGLPSSFGVDVPAGSSTAELALPKEVLAKPGTFVLHAEGAGQPSVKLTVARPALRFVCPSTVDVGATIELAIVLDAPAPADGYRFRLSQFAMPGPGRAAQGHVEELVFKEGETRLVVKLRVWDTFQIEVTARDALDTAGQAPEQRDRCTMSVHGASPPPRGGGLI